MAHAEALLGIRDTTKQLCQPTFHQKGPFLRNTPNLDGAFAELSINAAGYWPTVVFELSHETVHLLDPVIGITNWLEEGAAVEFSVQMTRQLTNHPMEPAPGSNYALARTLVAELPLQPLRSVGELRQRFGALSSISAEQISATFPSVSSHVAEQLASPCKPR